MKKLLAVVKEFKLEKLVQLANKTIQSRQNWCDRIAEAPASPEIRRNLKIIIQDSANRGSQWIIKDHPGDSIEGRSHENIDRQIT